jgi:hypothetical protein
MMEYEFDRYTKVKLVAGDVAKDNDFEFVAHISYAKHFTIQ